MPQSDGFEPAPSDPLRKQHELLNKLLSECDSGSLAPSFVNVEKMDGGRAILLRLTALEAAMNAVPAKSRDNYDFHVEVSWNKLQGPHSAFMATLKALLKRNLPLSDVDLLALSAWLCSAKPLFHNWYPIPGTIQNFEHFRATNSFSQKLNKQVEALVKKIQADVGEKDGRQKFVSRLQKLIGTLPKLPLFAGEAWSDTAIADLKKMPRELQSAWLDVLAHCQATSGSSPSASWIKQAGEVVKVLTWPRFKKTALAWLPLVNLPRTKVIADWHRDFQPDPNQLIIEPHSELLKGLAWLCGFREDAELARALTALALSCYRKIPKKGPREVKVGNACVTALGMMPGMEGVGELALLKVRVKFGTAQKMIEKALEATAARVGLPREELEEMAVPAYGLTEVGRCIEKFGDCTAELAVTGTNSTEIAWLKPDGKRQQSVPAVVKEKFADDFKELQAAAKDIQRMLPAQRERIDGLFLQQKRWPFAVWRERYLEHPLVGVLARRLLWVFTNGKKNTAGIWFNGQLVDIDLKPVKELGAETTVTLWHPIGRDLDEIVGWRAWLDAQQIQ